MLTAIVVIGFVASVAVDYTPMHKDMKSKERFWYFALLGMGFCVLLLYSFRISIPSPTKGMTYILYKLFPMLEQ